MWVLFHPWSISEINRLPAFQYFSFKTANLTCKMSAAGTFDCFSMVFIWSVTVFQYGYSVIIAFFGSLLSVCIFDNAVLLLCSVTLIFVTFTHLKLRIPVNMHSLEHTAKGRGYQHFTFSENISCLVWSNLQSWNLSKIQLDKVA